MQTVTLQVNPREKTGKQVKEIRQQGLVPGVVYGHGVEPRAISFKRSEFDKAYQVAGDSTLVDLKLAEAAPVKVLVQDVQRDPITDEVLHVDFHQVRMDEKVKADVKLEFINVPPAVKELGAILVTNVDSIEIECLPSDLVHEITVDLSTLKTFEDTIRVKDLQVPKGAEILDDLEEVVALVQEPRSEQEVEAAAGPAPEVVLPEGVKEEPKEGEAQDGKEKSE